MKYSNVLLTGLCAAVITSYGQPVLNFATEATYPPFVSMSSDNTMVGYGPDLVHAICKKIHKQCKLINAPWDSLIPSLKIGKYDALFGGMGITKERKQVVNFSSPYYQNASVFVINKGGKLPFNMNSLKGKTIAAQSGSTFAQYIQQKFGDSVTLKTYASNMTALMDLKSGRVDAVFLDKPVAKVWLSKSGNNQFTAAGNIVDPSFFGPGNAVAVNKGNTKLLKQIDVALKQLKQNGVLKNLQKKWFGK